MNSKKIILIVMFLITILSFASADILPEGHKGISYCFEIENIDDFPDHVVLVSFGFRQGHDPSSPLREIKEGNCIRFYKFHTPIFYSVNSDYFEENIKENFIILEKIKDDNNVIKFTDINLRPVSSVLSRDPTKSVRDVLRITELSEDSLILEKYKVVYTYEDGKTEEIMYTSQDKRPRGSRQPIIPVGYRIIWSVFIPLIAFISLVLILVVRIIKKWI